MRQYNMKDIVFIITITDNKIPNKTVDSITKVMESLSYSYVIYIIEGSKHSSNIKQVLKQINSKYIKILDNRTLLQDNIVKQIEYLNTTDVDVCCSEYLNEYYDKDIITSIQNIFENETITNNTLLFTNKIKESYLFLKLPKIIQDHNSKEYKTKQTVLSNGKHNGAYYYSLEIVNDFISQINTTYNWQTIYHKSAPEHCIVFIHANNKLGLYDYLLKYKDVVLVCSTKHSQEQLLKKGHKKVIYLTLSVDTKTLDKYKNKNKKGIIACGNLWAFTDETKQYFRDNNIIHYHDVERNQLLTLIGKAKTVYAIGRTAMEAIYLGAEVIQPDKEYPIEKYDRYYTQDECIKILREELIKIETIL